MACDIIRQHNRDAGRLLSEGRLLGDSILAQDDRRGSCAPPFQLLDDQTV
jgi:hypothetical protein